MNKLKKTLAQLPFDLTDWIGSKTLFILLISGILKLFTSEAQLDVIKDTDVYLWNFFILLIVLAILYFGIVGEFKHEVRQFQKPYDNQQAEQISLMV